jgi:hypothetical protein
MKSFNSKQGLFVHVLFCPLPQLLQELKVVGSLAWLAEFPSGTIY